MKKDQIFRYILLIILGIIVILQLFFGSLRSRKNDTSFAIKEGAEVTGIDLIQADKKITLRKDGEVWRVNKNTEARKNAILLLIKTLREIRIKSPVSENIFIDEIAGKKIEPVRVNVFQKRRLIKSFYVFKTSSNIYGNIMKMRPSSRPYIVYMPGYEDNIGSHFIAEELYWEPFTVFRLLPSQIESIEFQNVNNPEESFFIRKNHNNFLLSDFKNEVAGYDSLKVKRYVSYFVSVAFETWAFDLNEEGRREIESSTPLFNIIVKIADGKVNRLRVWERWKLEGDEKVKDTDRVWAETDDGKGLFIMRYFDLDPIIKKKSYFFGG